MSKTTMTEEPKTSTAGSFSQSPAAHHDGPAMQQQETKPSPPAGTTKPAPKDAPGVTAAIIETNNSAYPYYNVAGSLKHQHHQISGNPGDTLVVGLIFVYQVIFDPGVMTGYTVTGIGNGQSSIAFAASAAFTNVNVLIIGQ